MGVPQGHRRTDRHVELQNSKNENEAKLTKLKMQQKSKNQNVTKLTNSKCDKTKKKSKFGKTLKFKI